MSTVVEITYITELYRRCGTIFESLLPCSVEAKDGKGCAPDVCSGCDPFRRAGLYRAPGDECLRFAEFSWQLVCPVVQRTKMRLCSEPLQKRALQRNLALYCETLKP